VGNVIAVGCALRVLIRQVFLIPLGTKIVLEF